MPSSEWVTEEVRVTSRGGWARLEISIRPTAPDTRGAPLLAVFEKWPTCIQERVVTLRRYPPPHRVRGFAIILSCVRQNLKRYYDAGHLHFITCSCYRRQPMLGTGRRRDLLLSVLEQTRRRYQFVVAGYVVMPEHIHLLISEPDKKTPSTVMQALKLGFARRLLAQVKRRRNPAQADLFERTPEHIWQKRFYDFNVWSERKRVEKLRYMHCNPVKRGLVGSPELWRWSSFRAYALAEKGAVKVNDWGVLKLKIRSPLR